MTTKDSSVAPLVLLGETRKRSLNERLAQWLKEWRQERCVVSSTAMDPIAEQLDPGMLTTLRTSAKWIASGSVNGLAMVYVFADLDAPSDLFGLPRKASAHDPANSPIATSLVAGLLESLAAVILVRAQYQSSQVTTSAVAPSEFLGGQTLAIWWGVSWGESLSLLLHPQLVSLLAPPKKSNAGTPVDKRRAAIGDETIKLQAVLGNADVSVGGLSSLRINDVIVLSSAINQPGQLRTHTGAHVANISVGRMDGKRAVVVMKP